MVVGHAGQHAHFVELHIPGQLEVVLVGPNPPGHARKAVAPRPADFDGFAVLGRVHEKFRSPDQAALAAEFVQQIEHAGDLLDGIRGAGLLAVAERGVGNEHRFRGTRHHQHVVEIGAGDAGVGKELPVELRLLGFFQSKDFGGSFLMQNRHFCS